MLAIRNYFKAVQRSLAVVAGVLETPRRARRTVAVLLAIHTGLLVYSAYIHSPTLNEPGHLVAGLSIWKFGRFSVYSVNPPLVKMVAALPVMAAGYEEDWSAFHTGLGARPEFSMGEDFVAANGERSFFLFMIARWACIPFSWIGATVCYLWARDLYGRPAGVVACGLWCFEPNILAHASLITPDAHATALGLAACYTFWRWLKHPTWLQAAVTGVVLGLAELAKTTLIVLLPLWWLLWLVYRWSDRQVMTARDWLREAGMLLVRMAIGLYVLNLGYGFEGSLKSLGEFRFVSNLFRGSSDSYNRFAGSWLAAVPAPFPEHYLVGIDLQQHDFEDYGRPSYLRGEWRNQGWWYYYLYAALIKVPLGLWILGVFTLITPRHTNARDELVLLAPALTVFIIVSAKYGFNEHFRYVLPCFPLAFVWISQIAHVFSRNSLTERPAAHRLLPAEVRFALPLLIVIAGGWFLASSLVVYPHSLSYFNEAVGGPRHGAEHLLGSNVDWGQDLLYLKRDLEAHASIERLYLASQAFYDPAFVGFRYKPLAVSASNELGVDVNRRPEEGPFYTAISVSFLLGQPGHVYTGQGERMQLSKDALKGFERLNRIRSAGYSMSIYWH